MEEKTGASRKIEAMTAEQVKTDRSMSLPHVISSTKNIHSMLKRMSQVVKIELKLE